MNICSVRQTALPPVTGTDSWISKIALTFIDDQYQHGVIRFHWPEQRCQTGSPWLDVSHACHTHSSFANGKTVKHHVTGTWCLEFDTCGREQSHGNANSIQPQHQLTLTQTGKEMPLVYLVGLILPCGCKLIQRRT